MLKFRMALVILKNFSSKGIRGRMEGGADFDLDQKNSMYASLLTEFRIHGNYFYDGNSYNGSDHTLFPRTASGTGSPE
jgi:hypothetical protein